jgi:transcriptional regulator with XRE-family HTH domain
MGTPLGDRVRRLRAKQRISADSLAKAIGLKRAAIYARESGASRFKAEEIPKLAAVLGESPELLRKLLLTEESPKQGRIPLVGDVPAGVTLDREQGVHLEGGSMSIDRGVGSELTDFAIVVNGSSMSPTVNNGDIVECVSINQYDDDMPEPGCVAYVRLGPDSKIPGVMLCRWFPQPDGTYRLAKDNPAYRELVVPREHVVEFARAVRRRSPL